MLGSVLVWVRRGYGVRGELFDLDGEEADVGEDHRHELGHVVVGERRDEFGNFLDEEVCLEIADAHVVFGLQLRQRLGQVFVCVVQGLPVQDEDVARLHREVEDEREQREDPAEEHAVDVDDQLRQPSSDVHQLRVRVREVVHLDLHHRRGLRVAPNPDRRKRRLGDFSLRDEADLLTQAYSVGHFVALEVHLHVCEDHRGVDQRHVRDVPDVAQVQAFELQEDQLFGLRLLVDQADAQVVHLQDHLEQV